MLANKAIQLQGGRSHAAGKRGKRVTYVVIWVQDSGYVFCQVSVQHCLDVVTHVDWSKTEIHTALQQVSRVRQVPDIVLFLVKRFVIGTFRLVLVEYQWECTYVKGTRETEDGLKERQISMQFLKTHMSGRTDRN